MVCDRCISAVQNIFDKVGVNLKSIHLGEVETDSEIPENKFSDIQKNLEDIGFEIIKMQLNNSLKTKKILLFLKSEDWKQMKILFYQTF